MSTFEALSYRDDEAGLRFRREELTAKRKAELDAAAPDLTRIYARRIARIAGGATAIAGAASVVVMSGIGYALRLAFDVRVLGEPPLTLTLMVTTFVVPLVMIVTSGAARLRMGATLRGALASTGDVRSDVARLEHAPPLRAITERVDALEERSVWAPLMGWALAAPLSLHLGFALVLGWIELPRIELGHSESFDAWILASIVLMGIGHAVLCMCAVRFARRLRVSGQTGNVKPPSIWAPYGWTLLGACIPGLILYALPPLIAAATSLFIPFTFGSLKGRVHAERTVLLLHDPG